MHFHGNERLEEETSEFFNIFLKKSIETDPENFRGVCMEGIAAVEDIVQADILLFDIDIVDGSMIVASGNTLLLYGYYVIIVTFAMYPISTLSSKPIVVHRVINSSNGFIIQSNTGILAKKELNIFL